MHNFLHYPKARYFKTKNSKRSLLAENHFEEIRRSATGSEFRKD